MTGHKPFSVLLAPYLPRVLAAALLVFYLLNHFASLPAQASGIMLVFMVSLLGVFVLCYKQHLLSFLALFVPLSTSTPVFESSNISLPTEPICLLLTAFFITKVILGRKLPLRFLKHPLSLLILADLLWLFISACTSQMPEVSFKRLIIRTCYYTAFYYFYSELFSADIQNIRRIFLYYTLGMVLPVVLTVYKHSTIGFITIGSEKLSEPYYYDHTIYGACLAFYLPFTAELVLKTRAGRLRVLYMALLGLLFVALLFSYSRAAWLGLLVALGAFTILRYKVKLRYLAALAILALLGVWTYWPELSAKLQGNKQQSHSNEIGTHFKSISNINTDVSNRERINRWKCAIRMFRDKPVFGFGPGTYQFYYGQYQQRADLTRISTFTGNKGHAHSEYLNYLSETGLPGLLIFLALMIVALCKSIRLLRYSGNPEIRQIGAFLFMGLVTYCVHACFNGFLEFDKVAFPVFTSLAAIVALDKKDAKSGEKPS
ncbi:MAG TPA: O-antigen ligase family protein [Bacteroidia bacterium]|nr:O-antigen ligase family protein [Bacteroidia bacterium]